MGGMLRQAKRAGAESRAEPEVKSGARAGLAALAGLLCSLLWTFAAAQAVAEDRPAIKVAIEGAYPPFNYLDQNNELQGFEVDLLKALCDTMQAQCTLVTHEWDGIIRGLLNHEYDAIASSLEINERRAKRIAFSRRYYLIPAPFIAAAAEPIKDPTPVTLA